MKGNESVIKSLNELLQEELTAVAQYDIHAAKLKNWKIKKLSRHIKDHAKLEREHSNELTKRILFLEGEPYSAQIRKLNIGNDVVSIIDNNLLLERSAQISYNEAIEEARSASDNRTRKLLEHILSEEEDEHIAYLEAAKEQIAMIGLENYISTKN